MLNPWNALPFYGILQMQSLNVIEVDSAICMLVNLHILHQTMFKHLVKAWGVV